MQLIDKVTTDIKEAMRLKDKGTLRGLRAIKAALLLFKTQESTKEIKPEDEIKILQKLVKQRKESIEIYTSQNRQDLAKE